MNMFLRNIESADLLVNAQTPPTLKWRIKCKTNKTDHKILLKSARKTTLIKTVNRSRRMSVPIRTVATVRKVCPA